MPATIAELKQLVSEHCHASAPAVRLVLVRLAGESRE